MKAIMLSAAAAALGMAAPATASVMSVGNSLAEGCYVNSLQSNATRYLLDDCNRAIFEEPLSVEDRVATLVNRGIIKMKLSMYQGADADFDAAIGLNELQAEAWLNKGLLRLRQDRPADAIPLIERSLELKTMKPALATYARGMAHEQLGRISAAYSDYSRARELDPKWSLPRRELARFQVQQR